MDKLPQELRDGVQGLAAAMRANGTARHDPMRAMTAHIGDRWSTLILILLSIGTFRHAELKRTVAALSAEGKISQRVLTAKLRTLERDGLVQRDAAEAASPVVHYSLTPMGQGFVAEVERMHRWIVDHQNAVHTARAVFDKRDAL
jgi:DNA-binding HxlR family transcriptional regulator